MSRWQKATGCIAAAVGFFAFQVSAMFWLVFFLAESAINFLFSRNEDE